MMSRSSQADELAQNGYCVVPDVLDAAMLQLLRGRFSDTALSGTPQDHFGTSGAFIVADYHDPVMVDVLTWPKTLTTLASFGFAQPKLHNFYVSTKPPEAHALTWHSDLFYQYDEPEPAELFLIYYLQDTSPENGCLRVVPGSHKWSHQKRHAQPEDAERRNDEVDVPVKASDLFIGDRRILHATHANNTALWRTCLTIAYAPLFDALSEPIQALIVQNRCLPPEGWWNYDDQHDIDERLQRILPVYRGSAQPIALE
jgi:ectoine hydroxylase-related dioxygenase (phytanoyl-CoA dioxygenase family)